MFFNQFLLKVILAYFLSPIGSDSVVVESKSTFKVLTECPKGSQCRETLKCQGIALIGANLAQADNQLCILDRKLRSLGVCCPTILSNSFKESRASPIKPLEYEIDPQFRQSQLNQQQNAKARNGQYQDRRIPISSKSDSKETSYQPNSRNQQNSNAKRLLAKNFNVISSSQANELKEPVHFIKVSPWSDLPNVTCTSSKYRTIDGSCNNLQNPTWGKTLTPYDRVFTPQYEDGIESPKIAKSGKELPPARLVSYNVAKDRSATSSVLDTLFLAYGQWLDHDLTQVIGTTLPNGETIKCCDGLLPKAKESSHSACMPILIPEDDPFFAQFGVRCLEFVRTALAPRTDGQMGPLQQINNLTPWVDGSIIYGASMEVAKMLRSFKDGKLLMQTASSGQILPTTNNSCYHDFKCFEGADSRVNQQPGLMAMHIVFAREHNRIAEELKKLNPNWNEETLYQEARRIVVAEFQHITYNEFLPLVIGPKNMQEYGLYSINEGFRSDYDKRLDPSIIMEFPSAAFRLHSLIPPIIEMRDDSHEIVKTLPLREEFNNPSIYHQARGLEELVNGATCQATSAADNLYSSAITNHLFKKANESFGSDLFSIDIQRGRDHGLAGYNDWREACGFGRVSSFKELDDLAVYSESIPILEALYESVDDIDLIVGLNFEHRQGMAVGPTAACIITETFRRFKFADRFWYENGDQVHSFNEDQLDAIRQITFARILCDNSDISQIQGMAFIQPSQSNPRENCEDLSSISLNLLLWKNEPM